MPSNLSNQDVGLSQLMFTSSAAQQADLGARGYTSDRRAFVYVQAGASDLVAGNVIQSPATVPNHLANTPPVVAAGATSFTYTPGATLGTLNQYADGYLNVDTTPGLGQTLRIQGHLAFALSTAFTLNLDDPIQVALTASSRVGLTPNRYRGVIQSPVTTATGIVVGVATYVITAAQYGWVQTGGPCGVLIAGTPALGALVMAPGAVAGAAEIMTTTNLVVAQVVGNMMQVGVAGKANMVNLTIAV